MTTIQRTHAFALSALALLCAPLAHAADYVQAPGSVLTFATEYQGEVFVGRFPTFDTRISFDPAQPQAGTLDVSIGLAGADTVQAAQPPRNPRTRATSIGQSSSTSRPTARSTGTRTP